MSKDLKHGFGDYVQVHVNEVDNSMRERTQAALALMPCGNREGSWYYLLLSNWQVVKRNMATPVPLPEDVIQYINAKAAERSGSRPKVPRFAMGRAINEVTDDEDQFEEQDDVEVPNGPNIVDQAPVEDEQYECSSDLQLGEDAVQHDQALLHDIWGVESDGDEPEERSTVLAPVAHDSADDAEQLAETPEEPAAEPQLQGVRRSARLAGLERTVWERKDVGSGRVTNASVRTRFMRREIGFKMTVGQAMAKVGDEAVVSSAKEMLQMVEKRVFHGRHFSELTLPEQRKIITSSLFLKEKYYADGLFEKLKARLVAGGHLQDRELYSNGKSPTVATQAVMMVAAIAGAEGRAVATVDFPGAFLNVDMNKAGVEPVLVKLNKFLTKVLVSE
jgi:hypothetical protein